MINLFNYTRRQSSAVQVGNTPLGADNPIRVQSMTTTSTNDIEASVAQTLRIVEAGGEYVRLTTQGAEEAENRSVSRESPGQLGLRSGLPWQADRR